MLWDLCICVTSSDIGCRCAPIHDAQLWLLPAHCPKTLNCVKIEPNTGSCSGLHIRDPKGKPLLFDSRMSDVEVDALALQSWWCPA